MRAALAPGGPVRRLAPLLALLALLAAPAAALQEERTLFVGGCETARIRPGDEGSRGSVLHGLSPASRGSRTFARAMGESAVLLILNADGPRSLRIVARSPSNGMALRARFNGVALGSRELSSSWRPLVWSVPAEALRQGANVLRMEPLAESARASQKRGYAVKEIVVDPSGGCSSNRAFAVVLEPSATAQLPPGSTLLVPGSWTPGSRLDLRATTRWPATGLAVICYSPETVQPLLTVTGGRRRKLVELEPLAGGCGAASGLALTATGPGWVRVHEATIREQPARDWRGSVSLGAALVVLLSTAGAIAGLLIAAKWLARGTAPWLDVTLVVVVALGARLVFQHFYPSPGFSLDSYEYILRAGQLASGQASLLADTSWHAWQSFLRPPGYFLFLAGALKLHAGELAAAVWLQLAFSALTAGATYLVAYPLFGRFAALVSGIAWALCLASVTSFSRILAEPLFLLFLVPALAALAWTSLTRRWEPALASGLLFGLAALVRPGPLAFVAIAALLLLPLFGARKGIRLAASLLAGASLVAVPWIIRNSLISGEARGISDTTLPNLLIAHPDERFVPWADLDLGTEEGQTSYRRRVAVANTGGRLSDRKLEIVGGVLRRMTLDPLGTAARFASNLGRSLGPVGDEHLRIVLGDHHRVRVAWLTSIMNAQALLISVLGILGLIGSLRDRRVWPLALWWIFHTVVINLFFWPTPRFDIQALPVLIVFAGASVAALVARTRRFTFAAGPRGG